MSNLGQIGKYRLLLSPVLNNVIQELLQGYCSNYWW